jgi:hypothetical protein
MLGMLGDKKKIAQVILGEKPKSMDMDVPTGLEADFSSAYSQMGMKIMKAFKEGDPKSLAMSIKELVMMAEREEEYSEEG